MNGHLSAEIDAAGSDSRFRQPKLLYRNLGDGRFEDLSGSAGIAELLLRSGRGAAAADILNNGQVAVAVNEIGDRPSLLVSTRRSANHRLGVITRGSKSNRDGIGARLDLTCGALHQIDEIRSGGSYISQNELRAHFGLGRCAQAESLKVAWPSGRLDEWRNIPADQHILVEEGITHWKKAPTRKAA